MKKLAIIGASYLQLPLVKKAKEMGLHTFCFAWEDGAICKNDADEFYPISIVEKERILGICHERRIDGVCTIASDVAAPTVAYITEKMGLVGNSYEAAVRANNKFQMRNAFFKAGIPCPKYQIAEEYNLLVVEDAAQAIDSYYKGRPLGTIGHLSAFSFHETKNVISGEGGMLGINDERFIRRAEIIWEKGTNRAEFFRGEVNKYCWCDIGSSFLPSEVVAAFLWAQLEHLNDIQGKRKGLWNKYYELLKPLADEGQFRLPDIPEYATNNAHMFYLVCNNLQERTALIKKLKDNDVLAVFHYLSLHSSEYYKNKHDGRELPECDRYADCLVRLPMYYDLGMDDVEFVCSIIRK